MKLFNWVNVRLALVFLVVIFLFSFAAKRNNNRNLLKSVVVFTGNNDLFVEQKTVNKLLIENKLNASSIQKDKLDLNKLESILNRHQMIENSDVFVTIDGVLKAVVRQKTPVARVYGEDGSFYIDYQGNTMPLSGNYTARVLLVTGGINNKNSANLAKLFRKIYDDAFLKKNIIGIQIMDNGSLKMLNRNFNYVIDFGSVRDYEAKFNNYKAFFQRAVLDSSLNKYRKIDLRFTRQVVCTK